MRLPLSSIAEDLLAQLAVYDGPLPVFSAEAPIAAQLVDNGLAEWCGNARRLTVTDAGRAHHVLVLRRKGIA